MTWEQYVSMLEELGHYTKEEALAIATNTYKKQWGLTPQQHRVAIEAMWKNADAFKGKYLNQ